MKFYEKKKLLEMPQKLSYPNCYYAKSVRKIVRSWLFKYHIITIFLIAVALYSDRLQKGSPKAPPSVLHFSCASHSKTCSGEQGM